MEGNTLLSGDELIEFLKSKNIDIHKKHQFSKQDLIRIIEHMNEKYMDIIASSIGICFGEEITVGQLYLFCRTIENIYAMQKTHTAEELSYKQILEMIRNICIYFDSFEAFKEYCELCNELNREIKMDDSSSTLYEVRKCKTLVDYASRLSKENKILKQKAGSQAAKIAELENEIDNIYEQNVEELTEMQNTNNISSARITELTNELAKKTFDYDTLYDTFHKIKKAIKEKTDSYEELNKLYEKIAVENQTLKTGFNALQESYEILKLKSNSYMEQINEQQKKIHQKMLDIMRYEEDIRKLTESNTTLQEQNKKKIAENAMDMEHFGKVAKENAELGTIIVHKNFIIEELNAKISELESKLQNLNADEINTLRSENGNLHIEINTLKDNIGRLKHELSNANAIRTNQAETITKLEKEHQDLNTEHDELEKSYREKINLIDAAQRAMTAIKDMIANSKLLPNAEA